MAACLGKDVDGFLFFIFLFLKLKKHNTSRSVFENFSSEGVDFPVPEICVIVTVS